MSNKENIEHIEEATKRMLVDEEVIGSKDIVENACIIGKKFHVDVYARNGFETFSYLRDLGFQTEGNHAKMIGMEVYPGVTLVGEVSWFFDQEEIEHNSKYYPPDVEPIPNDDSFFKYLHDLLEVCEMGGMDRYRMLCGMIEFAEEQKTQAQFEGQMSAIDENEEENND